MIHQFHQLLGQAIDKKATDIHFVLSSQQESCSIRSIKGFEEITDVQISSLFHYLKYRANLNLGNLSVPQSGTFSEEFEGNCYYFRFSCLTTLQSQTGVLRILNNHAGVHIDNCSTDPQQNKIFQNWCQQRSGLILFTGPTSSGKTTTLHAILENIAKEGKLKVITLEDPIEIVDSSYLQLQVNEKLNFTYEEGIKQLLRHDPDVIMIGEVRDAQTAKNVFRAALSGHLVFTTLHAKSATEAIKRFCEFGFTPDELLHTLTAVVNQRLYPNYTKKGRVCIYEILQGKELNLYLSTQQLPANHSTIFDQIEKAVENKTIRRKDAKVDLLDQATRSR